MSGAWVLLIHRTGRFTHLDCPSCDYSVGTNEPLVPTVNFLGSEPAADPVLQRLIDDIASHIMSEHA